MRRWTEGRSWPEKWPRTQSFFDASQTERSLVRGGYEAARGFFIAPLGKRKREDKEERMGTKKKVSAERKLYREKKMLNL